MVIFQPKTVSNVLAQLSLRGAASRGIGPDEFRRLTGIAQLETTQLNGRIAGAKHIAMLNLTEPGWMPGHVFHGELGAPLFAPLSTVLGVVTNAPRLSAAFDDYLQLRTLIGNVDQLAMRRAGDDFVWEYTLEGEGRRAVSAFGNLLLISKLVRQYTMDTQQHMAIELTGKAFSSIPQLTELGPFTVSFGQGANRLRFSTALADAPYPLHNPLSYQILRGQARLELRGLNAAHSFSMQLEDRLTQLLRQHDGVAQAQPLALVCADLAITRSGLHRRLHKEATNFQAILAGVRLAEARRLLRQPGLSVSEISDLLGFSSPSAFSRFFSGHGGGTPSHYRRTQALLTA